MPAPPRCCPLLPALPPLPAHHALTAPLPALLLPRHCLQSLPCRPIMLDTANASLAYPSLEHRLRKVEKKSVLSSFFGWGSSGAKK